ncbi:hypothetical protein EE09_45 [Escherichia phage vB_EcoS-EE09]|nr:hypothetical protein EE09_45 [Escherichia phage vB_EcoS-EE09]
MGAPYWQTGMGNSMLYVFAVVCGGSLAALVLLASVISLVKYLWSRL